MKPPTDGVDRLAALVEQALAGAEARAAAGEAVSATELGGLRRLIEWVRRERETEDAIALSRGERK